MKNQSFIFMSMIMAVVAKGGGSSEGVAWVVVVVAVALVVETGGIVDPFYAWEYVLQCFLVPFTVLGDGGGGVNGGNDGGGGGAGGGGSGVGGGGGVGEGVGGGSIDDPFNI